MRGWSRIGCLAGFAALLALPAWARGDDVVVATDAGGQSHLADGKGFTLYTFTKDTAGTSACTGPCESKWPPFQQKGVSPGPGLDPKSFGSIDRPGGGQQTTYRGMPLYRYSGDKAPGDTKGQGIGNAWYVAKP